MLQDHEINRLMLENLQSVIYLCRNDAVFTLLRLNGRVEEISGYTIEDFMSGRVKVPNLCHPDDQQMIFEEVKKAAMEDRAFQFIYRMRHRNGDWLWVESIGKLIVDENDPDNSYLSGFLLDITDRERMQDELRKLSEIVRNSPASVVVTDIDGAIEYVNPKFVELTGYSAEEALGKNPSILKTGVQPQEYYEELWQTILSGQEWRGEFANKKKNGDYYWELASISPVLNEAGEVESFVAVKEDITERKFAEEALAKAKMVLEEKVIELERRNQETALFSEMQAAFLNCEQEEETYQVLSAYAGQLFPDIPGSLYKMSPDGETSRLVDWGEADGDVPDFPFLDQMDEESQARETVTQPFLADCYIGDDDSIAAQQSLCIPLYTHGALWGVFQLVLQPGQKVKQIQQLTVSVVQQFLLTVENLRLREELRMQAVRDPLTGLYNRRYLEAALEREISRALRKDMMLGVIMLDIDRFKQFNDRYGHEVGDIVLRQIGLFLQSSVRSGDIVCRFGGEEFLVILPEINLESAVQRAESLRLGVQTLNNKKHRLFPEQLSISLGVALCPLHGDSGHAIMQAADQAMYQAKREGRNRVKVFDA